MAHRKFHSFAVVGAVGLCFGWASSVARADLFVTPTIGGSPTGAGSVFVNFDTMTDGVTPGQALVRKTTARCLTVVLIRSQ